MTASHRWMKFWPQDWERDSCLADCSLAAQGLWIRMLCLMHEASPRGHLVQNGKQVSDTKLARASRISEREVLRLVNELEAEGVFSRTPEGTIFSRRMVRDDALSVQGKQNAGKRWAKGKPKGHPNSKPNGVPKGHPNSLEAEAEAEADSRPLPNGSPNGVRFVLPGVKIREDNGRPEVNGFYLDRAWHLVAASGRMDEEAWRGDLSPLIGWLQAGILPETIAAAIERVASRSSYVPPRSLGFFDGAVREQRSSHAA